MLFSDTYRTISEPSEGIFRDKGSKFIGLAYPILTEKEVKDILINVRNEHPKARHFCWAIRLSPDRNVFKFNDDGEPSGTAGRPILNTLLSFDVTQVLVVVVRYFGGTLLGVSGLINAYKNATITTLNAANIIEKTVNDIYEFTFEYLQMNEVMRIVKEENLEVLQQEFQINCSITISIRKSILDKVLTKLEKIDHLQSRYLYTA